MDEGDTSVLCDPDVCGNYFGCGWWMADSGAHATDGSTQFDSIAVFDNGSEVLVNATDCRWPLSERACHVVNDQYEDIDLLLMQYSAANFYPECMDDRRQQIGFETDTTVLLDLVADAVAALSMNGAGYEIITADEARDVHPYVRITIDDRLLHRILRGPQYAHFNNAQIGSHIGFQKDPDIYERPIYYVMRFFPG